MKKLFSTILVSLLLATPALALEDAVPGKAPRKAVTTYALDRPDAQRISVPFDLAIVRPLALIGGTARLGFVALFQSQSLGTEAGNLVQYVFVDPIGRH